MRFVAVAADVAMGIFLGIFLFAVLTRFWPSLATLPVALVSLLAAIAIVVFRRPNGSLAARKDRTSG
jgi:hypothetical protein